MPGMNGLAASRTAIARRDTVIKAIQAGARDFIAKALTVRED
ncbi:hypothetical protein AB1L17_08370 [Brevibacillus sp. 179-C8.2 HS]